MSFVEFKDSFERYDVGNVSSALLDNFLSRWTTVFGVPEIITDGRTAQAVRLGGATIAKTLPHSARWVIGWAYRLKASAPRDLDVYSLSNDVNILARVLIDADGTLSLRAGNSTIVGVTERALNVNHWYYIEVDVTLSGGSPIMAAIEVRINGKVAASGSGSTLINDTDNLSQDNQGNYHQFSGLTGVGNDSDFDDLYIKNEAGYEGDPRVVPKYPEADGLITDWTPNSGSTTFDRVDTHPVDLSKWIETATPNDIALWTMTLPSFSGTIPAINFSVLARKDDEGTKSFKIVFGPAGTDAESDEFFVSDVTPEYYEWSIKTDPTTGSPWAPGGTITWGVKLIS